MNIRFRMIWAGCALLALSAASSAAEDPLAAYYDNTLIWQNQATKAIGRLWLNRNGGYFAFYNVGPQSQPPYIDGPFQVQGREGSYTVRNSGGKLQLCLWPAAPRIVIGAEKQRELYAEGSCYAFEPHAVGTQWTQNADPLNRPYKFWFVRGR